MCYRLSSVKFQELYMTTSWVSGAVVPAMGPQNTAEASAKAQTDRNVSLHCSCALSSLIQVRNDEVTNIPFFLSFVMCRECHRSSRQESVADISGRQFLPKLTLRKFPCWKKNCRLWARGVLEESPMKTWCLRKTRYMEERSCLGSDLTARDKVWKPLLGWRSPCNGLGLSLGGDETDT